VQENQPHTNAIMGAAIVSARCAPSSLQNENNINNNMDVYQLYVTRDKTTNNIVAVDGKFPRQPPASLANAISTRNSFCSFTLFLVQYY
jgi:hypothetical protein